MQDDEPDRTGERELLAQLNLGHFRDLRLASLRWLGAASLPMWAQVHTRALPGLVAWLAFLAQGYCLVAAGVQAALEYRSARRAGPLGADVSGVVVHAAWSDWDELRSALWWSLSAVSLVPWLYVGLGRPLPAPLLPPLTASAVAVLFLVVAAEAVAGLRLVRAARRSGHASALGRGEVS